MLYPSPLSRLALRLAIYALLATLVGLVGCSSLVLSYGGLLPSDWVH